MQHSSEKLFRFGFILTFVLLAILFGYAAQLPYPELKALISEGGTIENLSAIGYFLCAIVVVFYGKTEYLKQRFYFFLLPLLFGLRELDFDKRFTPIGILKGRFYSSDDISIQLKLIGLLVIIALLYMVISIVKNHLVPYIKRFNKNLLLNLGIFSVFASLVVAKTFDGLARKLHGLGIDIPHSVASLTTAAEEILELGVPYLMLQCFVLYFIQQRQAPAPIEVASKKAA